VTRSQVKEGDVPSAAAQQRQANLDSCAKQIERRFWPQEAVSLPSRRGRSRSNFRDLLARRKSPETDIMAIRDQERQFREPESSRSMARSAILAPPDRARSSRTINRRTRQRDRSRPDGELQTKLTTVFPLVAKGYYARNSNSRSNAREPRRRRICLAESDIVRFGKLSKKRNFRSSKLASNSTMKSRPR